MNIAQVRELLANRERFMRKAHKRRMSGKRGWRRMAYKVYMIDLTLRDCPELVADVLKQSA